MPRNRLLLASTLMSLAVALALAAPGAAKATPDDTQSGGELPILVQEQPSERAPPSETAPGEVIVRFAASTPDSVRAASLARADARFERDLRLPAHSVVRVPPGREREFATRIRGQPGVVSAEPNLIRHAAFTPDDPQFPLQWHFAQIGLTTAWDKTAGAGVTVAVIDTGVAYEDCAAATCGADYIRAPDFNGTSFVSPFDFANGDSHPNDAHGHGTHVASTVAETTNNAVGAAGVAFDAEIMPVQVLDENGFGTVADEIEALVWATDNGADVINLSLGGSGTSSAERAAIDYAVQSGVVVVAAAGNGGGDGNGDPVLDCPACYPGVVAVGATRFDKTRARYSNYGDGVDGHTLDLVAPGGDVFVDQNGDKLADGVLQQTFRHFCSASPTDFTDFVLCAAQGTSMATPHVAGLAALVLSINPTLTPPDVRDVLAGTAEDVGPAGCDFEYGNGLIDAAAAVAAAQASLSGPVPTPSCEVDTDGDGCTAAQELGPNPAAGGGRDPNVFWDFFDTPDAGNVRDRTIVTDDIFRVVERFGGTGADISVSDALSPPPPTGYHAAFDRSAAPGSFSGPADGAIIVDDIFFAVGQFGHSCAAQ